MSEQRFQIGDIVKECYEPKGYYKTNGAFFKEPDNIFLIVDVKADLRGKYHRYTVLVLKNGYSLKTFLEDVPPNWVYRKIS